MCLSSSSTESVCFFVTWSRCFSAREASSSDTIHKLVKDHEVSEDDASRAEKHLDQVTKKHTDSVDELLKHKEAELLEL